MVPTAAPVFDSSMHNGVVQSEQRKEAMLIDL
jgi:growth factor-regulated tyrosine kinase substrate